MTFNFGTFVFEVINFVVLAAVLYRLLYRPLREAVDRRKADNDRTRAEAEASLKAAEATRQQLAQELAEIEAHREAVLEKANQAAEVEAAKRQAEAEAAARAVRDQAGKDAEQLRRDTLSGLEGEVAVLAVELADRLLAQAATTSLNAELTRRLVESLHSTPAVDRDRLREEAGPAAAEVQSALALDEPLRQALTEAVHELLGRPVEVQFEVVPVCVCGSRLSIGGRVWDSTAAGQMTAVRTSLKAGA